MTQYADARENIVRLECKKVGVEFEKYEDLDKSLRPDEYEESKVEVGDEVIKMAVSLKFKT